MPTVIREFARAGAGEVAAIAAGVFSSGELLTAVKNGSGNLELIVWTPDAANRALTRDVDSASQAGPVGEIALAMMGRRCLTAVQNADRFLLLIPWALETDGTISRLEYADHQAGNATYLTVVAMSDTLAVTAVRSGAGNLLLIPWSIDSASGHVSRLSNDSAQGGYVASWDMPHSPYTPQPEGPLIATAAIDLSNVITAKATGLGIEITAWALDATFKLLPWAHFAIDGLIDYVYLAPLGNPGQVRDFVLAYRTTTVVSNNTQSPTFSRELFVTLLRASEPDSSIIQVTQASAGDVGGVGITVGSLASNGRALIFLSARSGAMQVGDNPLVHMVFQLISDNAGRQTLIRTGDAHDSAYKYIYSAAPVALESGRFATAIAHDSGIGVVALEVSDLSATLFRPLAEAYAGDSSAIRLGAVNSEQVVVGLRNGSGNLELIGWNLAARDFAVSRTADSASHPIAARDVALVVVGQRAVTAIQSGSGRLRLDSWDLSADLSSITWLHQTGTAAGNADLITSTRLEPDLVVTAVRNASGKLLIIVWRLEADGTLSRLNHESAQAGEIDEIDLVTLDASNVVTAVRNGSGHLQIIGWHIDTTGTVTRWSTDGYAGDVSAVAAAVLAGAGPSPNIITAVRDGSDQLLVIVWQLSIENRSVTRLTDSGDQGHDGEVSDLSICIAPSPPSARQVIVTAYRRESGNLKLASWQLLDDPSGSPMLVQTGDMTNRADTDVRSTYCCSLETGRIAVAANLISKRNSGLWLSTIQVVDAQAIPAPANILNLVFDALGPPIPPDTFWAKSDGTYPTDRDFEWAQVQDPKQEYDDAKLIGVSGWIVAPENSGADVPFSHPFGFDWELSIALDDASKGLLSPANAGAEEGENSPNHNSIALADQLGLAVPEGLLGLEWDLGLLPASYRGQVNHGDRIAVLGRWILDQGHDVDGFYRTEIHPPLLVASAAVVQPPDLSARTRVLFMSRPFLSGQTFTTDLDTRYVDGVDDDGPLYKHAKRQLIDVLTVGSTMIEMHPKIKQMPFRGSHQAQFVVQPPGPRPPDAQLVVSYRFTVRDPCLVSVAALYNTLDNNYDAISVSVTLRDSADDGVHYQPPDLPAHHEETYSTDELDLLSPGAGDSVASGEDWIEALVAIFVLLGYGVYIREILTRGMKTDLFDPLPDLDILDPTGGVADVVAQQIVDGIGVVPGNSQPYPIAGWLEAYWVTPVLT